MIGASARFIWRPGLAFLLLAGSPAVAGTAPQALNDEGNDEVLWDQTQSPSGSGASDQDFEPTFDSHDSEGADDLEVPQGEDWLVTAMTTIGTQSTGLNEVALVPSSVSISFYPDDGGTPSATPICEHLDQTSFVGSTSITTTLDIPCNLPAGKYWVSHQVRQDLIPFGRHFWSGSSDQLLNGAVWRNPLDGLGTGCTDWQRLADCGVAIGSADFLFQLVGGRAFLGSALGWPGLAALVIALLAAGIAILRRRLRAP